MPLQIVRDGDKSATQIDVPDPLHGKYRLFARGVGGPIYVQISSSGTGANCGALDQMQGRHGVSYEWVVVVDSGTTGCPLRLTRVNAGDVKHKTK